MPPIAAHLLGRWFFPGRGWAGAGKSEAPSAHPLNPGKNSRGQSHLQAVSLQHFFSWLGVSLRIYYQVNATYKFISGKATLSSLSLNSSSVNYPSLVCLPGSILTQYRYFHSVKEAQGYIDYLFSRHPNCELPYPVLDAAQPLLF